MFAYGISIPTGLGILVASLLIFPLTERITNAKQVQIMTGVDSGTFWLANVIWDFAIYTLACALMFGILLALDEKGTFTTREAPCNVQLGFIMIPHALG